MRIGWVGTGKLGLPCATVLAQHHQVACTDVNPKVKDYIARPENIPYREEGLAELLIEGRRPAWYSSIAGVVEDSDVVFVAVQTPHAPEYEGDKPMPESREDFDYSYLAAAVREIDREAENQAKPIVLIVVSTVLPGTMEKVVRPILGPFVSLIYSPAFIAMGTCIADFTNPEMVLFGADDPVVAEDVIDEIYEPIHDAPLVSVSIASAELAKVAYNIYIGQKIVFANLMMEIAHKTAADADEVHQALSHATDRLHSPKYLKGGMGDGGGCHGRDQIAMSWLARRLDLSIDWPGNVMAAREAQSEWLASVVRHHAAVAGLPVVVLGKAYKAGTNLTVGSAATLLTHHLDVSQRYDPHTDGPLWKMPGPSVFVIATNHPEFADLDYPEGSVVVDPWAYVEDRPGVTVVRVGRKW